jgi:hypothetical protein
MSEWTIKRWKELRRNHVRKQRPTVGQNEWGIDGSQEKSVMNTCPLKGHFQEKSECKKRWNTNKGKLNSHTHTLSVPIITYHNYY